MLAGSRAALALTLVVALVGGALAGQVAAGTSQQVSQGEEPTVNMTVDLQADGDARWRVSTRFDLTSEAERESYRGLAESFESGETSALGLSAFRRASAAASDATGREMAIEDVERRTAPEPVVENGTGRLTVAFTWTNFGRTDEEGLHVDDVYAAEPDGVRWLPGLEAGDRLVVRAPEGYGVAEASVPPRSQDNRSVLRWTGPTTFDGGELAAEFTGQAGTPTPTPTPADPQGSIPWPVVLGLGLGGGVVAVYLLARRDGLPSPTPASSDPETGDTSHAGPSPDADADREAGADGASGSAGSDDDGDDDGIDEELLSDEERVERLLERNGGRMKQASIVKETGWSNAKVSQLLSAMAENDRIDKLRIGRENLISFPDEDVTDIEE